MAAGSFIAKLRGYRGAHLAVVNLRILIGFAFLPAGLKKILAQPFTDPANTGQFHDFLHAFAATGFFYRFVGGVQLVCAALLMTQVYAALGAVLALPVVTAIAVFCYSTGAGMPTQITVTLMWCGLAALALWDFDRWRGLVRPRARARDFGDSPPPVDSRLWRGCGIAILGVYLTSCLLYGGIYRPRGVDLGEPAFYLLPVLPLFPALTWFIEARRRRAHGGAS